jgi:hypothetical protein
VGLAGSLLLLKPPPSLYPPVWQQASKRRGYPRMCQRVERANRALSSVLAMEELRDLVTLPAGLSAVRPCPVFYLPVGKRKPWKSRFTMPGRQVLRFTWQQTLGGM